MLDQTPRRLLRPDDKKLEMLLNQLDGQEDDHEKRSERRFSYRVRRAVMRLKQAGSHTVRRRSRCTCAISAPTGMSFLHGAFVHTAPQCTVQLVSKDGKWMEIAGNDRQLPLPSGWRARDRHEARTSHRPDRLLLGRHQSQRSSSSTTTRMRQPSPAHTCSERSRTKSSHVRAGVNVGAGPHGSQRVRHDLHRLRDARHQRRVEGSRQLRQARASTACSSAVTAHEARTFATSSSQRRMRRRLCKPVTPKALQDIHERIARRSPCTAVP